MAPTRRARIRELVRHFKENGMPLMLEHPANVRDVLRLANVPWFDEIGFDRIQEIKTTFIRRNSVSCCVKPWLIWRVWKPKIASNGLICFPSLGR